MILDPNLERKTNPPLNHMLLFKYESPVDFSVTTHMPKVYNILKYCLGLEPKLETRHLLLLETWNGVRFPMWKIYRLYQDNEKQKIITSVTDKTKKEGITEW